MQVSKFHFHSIRRNWAWTEILEHSGEAMHCLCKSSCNLYVNLISLSPWLVLYMFHSSLAISVMGSPFFSYVFLLCINAGYRIFASIIGIILRHPWAWFNHLIRVFLTLKRELRDKAVIQISVLSMQSCPLPEWTPQASTFYHFSFSSSMHLISWSNINFIVDHLHIQFKLYYINEMKAKY